MSKEYLDRRKRRWAYRHLIGELGLAPPATDRSAGDWNPGQVAEKSIKTLKDLGVPGGVGDQNWIIAPATIKPDSAIASTAVEVLVNFLETNQTVSSLFKDLETYYKSTDGEAISDLVVRVGRSLGNPTVESNQKSFIEILGIEKAADVGKNLFLKQASKFTRNVGSRSKAAILQNMLESENLKVCNPDYKYTPDSPVNCAVHTLFINGTTSTEILGGTDTTLFMNYIPNSILSRAVPFLEISMTMGNKGRKRLFQSMGPSLILGDPLGSKKNPAFDARFATRISDKFPSPQPMITNDTFNLPQTLGSSRKQTAAFHNYPDPVPRDQFAPFVTIQDFSLNFDGSNLSDLMESAGLVKGNLKLFFPDKTKMTNVDQLILSSNNELKLELHFGWSISPNEIGDARSAIISYMNSQRIKIMTSTTMGSIRFTQSGGAEVDLLLYGTGDEKDPTVNMSNADISSHIEIFGRTQTRYLRFAENYLGRTSSQNQDILDLALPDDTSRVIRKVQPARKKSLNRKSRASISQGNKNRAVRHYSLAGLKKIKGSLNKFKDADLIAEKISTLADADDSEKQESYLSFDATSGVFYDYLTAIIEAAEHKHYNINRRNKKDRTKHALLKKAVTVKTMKVTAPKAKALQENYQAVRNAAESLYNSIDKKFKNNKKHKSAPEFIKLVKAKKVLTATLRTGCDILLTANLNARPIMNFIQSKGLNTPFPPTQDVINKNRETLVNVKASAVPFANFTVTKGPLPKSVLRPRTDAQLKQRNALQKKMKEISSLDESSLTNTRFVFMHFPRRFMLSNGIVVDRNPKSPKHLMSTGRPIPGDLQTSIKSNNHIASFWMQEGTKKRSPPAYRYLTLSYVVHTTLVQSLYASGDYEEIQVIYFKYNSKCARFSNQNIGDTPIHIDTIKSKWQGSEGDPYAFIGQLLGEINNSNSSGVPHGFRRKPGTSRKKGELYEDQVVPKVERINRMLSAKHPQKGKENVLVKILRIAFVDRTSTSDSGAGERIMNSMRDDGRTPAVSPPKGGLNAKNTEVIREKMLVKALQASKALSPPIAGQNGARTIKIGPKTYPIIKAAVKSVHPHINYGVTGGAIKGASVSGELTGIEKMAAFVKARRQFEERTANPKHTESTAGAPGVPLTTVTGANTSITLDLIGCPSLQIGAMYFIDFYTNTDIDNFYIVNKIEHKITGNSFTTSATLTLWDSSNKHTVPGDIDGINRLLETEDKQ